MSRLLSAPDVGAAVRTLGTPDPALDAALQARLAQAAAEARALGHREGMAAAAGAAEQAAARVVAALTRADGELRAIAAAADVDLALRIARAVLDREPRDGSMLLLERVREALARLDDERIAVHLHPRDAVVLHEPLQRVATGLGTALDVVEDTTIDEGEALLAGRWARADLTRAAALEAVEALLGAPADG